MAYKVKSIFYSLQGEGFHTGRAAVFCRFSDCNLACSFCDTNFNGTNGAGGGEFSNAKDLAQTIANHWPYKRGGRVIFTGGEPALQLDVPLINAVHSLGFGVAIETNGTLPVPNGIGWITVSPKADVQLVQKHGDELKLLYPQVGAEPELYEALDFKHFYLQPVAGGERDNRTVTARYCLDHPKWRLSAQIHKFFSLP